MAHTCAIRALFPKGRLVLLFGRLSLVVGFSFLFLNSCFHVAHWADFMFCFYVAYCDCSLTAPLSLAWNHFQCVFTVVGFCF